MTYKCVFYIDDEINIYHYINDEFVPLKYKGEISYSGDKEQLFSWFEEKIGYISEESKLDLCVLSCKEFDFDYESYNFTKENSWTGIEVKKFLFNIKNIKNSVLKFNDQEFLVNESNVVSEKIKFLNLNFYPSNEEINFEEEEIEEVEEFDLVEKNYDSTETQTEQKKEDKNLSVLAKYYREKTQNINSF